jgi:hypothetical protein
MTFPRAHIHPHPQAERNAVVTQTPHRQTGRMTAILGVATVAATAAVISFSHVQALARTAGEPELTAWLLPLSIDGAIAAAAAVVLADSKAGRRTTFLTWLMLALGLAASLAANIASAQPTWTARAVAAWPPIALALGIEVLASMSRRSGPIALAGTTARPEPRPWPHPGASRRPPPRPTQADRPPPHPPTRSPVQPARRRASSCTWWTEPAPAKPSRPAAERTEDDHAIEVIRRLDQVAGGQASRRTIQDELGCGASRATRLAALARTDARSGQMGQRSA